MSTWGSKHVEENSILGINNNQCIKLVINIWSTFIHTAEGVTITFMSPDHKLQFYEQIISVGY